MEPISIFIGIVTSVISSAIYSSIVNGGDRTLKFLFDEEEIAARIRDKVDFETLIEEKVTFEDFPKILESEDFIKFLKSEKTFNIVQMIYDSTILPNDVSILSTARHDFSDLLADFLEIDEPEKISKLGSQLFDLLLIACDRSLTKSIKEEDSLFAHESQSRVRFQMGHDEHMSLHDDHLALHEGQADIRKKIDELSDEFKSQNYDEGYQSLLETLRENVRENNPTEALKRVETLKKGIWEKSSPDIRYSLLSIEASAKLRLNKYQDAGGLLIEAFQYNDTEKAKVNAAYGYYLLGDYPTSKQLIGEVLDSNPHNARAFSVFIQMFTSEDELDDISSYLKHKQDVAYAIGNFFLKSNEFEKAVEWIEIAIDHEEENLLEMRPRLAGALLAIIQSNSKKIPEYQFGESDKNTLERIKDLITISWDSILDSNLKKIHVDWIINRGITNYLLGDIEGSENDLNHAFELDSSDSRCIYFKSLIEIENKEIEKAISLLKTVEYDSHMPEISLLYFDLLRRQGKPDDVITKVSEFLEQNNDFPKIDQLYRILIYAHLDSYPQSEDGVVKATELAEKRLGTDPTNIGNIIDLSRCLVKSDQVDSAITYLQKAKNNISISTPTFDVMELANDFFKLNCYEDASEIYEMFVDSTQITDLTHKLVESYYRYGDIKKALEISKSLRERFGPINHITNIEIAINHEINDLFESRNIITDYLEKYPDDMEMKLNLAFLDLRCNNAGDVEDFLTAQFDLSLLSVENGIRLAFLFNEMGYFKKAIDILYELRRSNFENEAVHIAYIKFILFNEDEKYKSWLSPEKVGMDTVVIIEDESGKELTYILENRNDRDYQKGEIGAESSIAKLVCGKTKGEKLTRKNSLFQEILEIKEIKSKYIHASQESLNIFDYIFPDAESLMKIPFPKSDDGDKLQESLEHIKNIARSRKEHNSKAINLYLEKKATIGCLAIYMSQNVFEIWFNFTTNTNLGIYCSTGNTHENKEALDTLKKSSKIIVDPLSLITLFKLNIGDTIVGNFGKLGIAQSTVDLIQESLLEQKKISSRTHGYLLDNDDNFIIYESDPKDVQEKTYLYEQMLKWISLNCEVLPCKEALSLRRDKKREYDGLLGKSFVDTILIASENNHILYSEDKILSLIAKHEFNVDSIWTQALVSHCLNSNIIDADQYNDLVIQLANLHYYHTSINSSILVEAAKRAKWKVAYPLKNVLNLLSGKFCDENSALNVSTVFLSTIWNEEISIDDLHFIVMKLLYTIVEGRFAPVFIDELKNRVDGSIHLLCKEDRDKILELIGLWETVYYKSI